MAKHNPFKVGDTAKVVRGPFSGWIGQVQDRAEGAVQIAFAPESTKVDEPDNPVERIWFRAHFLYLVDTDNT